MVDGAIRLVDAVGAVSAAVVGQAAGNREARTGEDYRRVREAIRGGSSEEAEEGGNGGGEDRSRFGDDSWRGEGVAVWDSHLARGVGRCRCKRDDVLSVQDEECYNIDPRRIGCGRADDSIDK